MSQYMDDQWTEGSGPELLSKDPLDQELIWSGREASTEQAHQVIQISKDRFFSWSHTSFEQREEIMKNYGRVLNHKKDELALLISKEMGKPLWESLTEVQAMIAKVDLSIKAHLDRCGERRQSLEDALSITRFHPIGVCLILGPFNLPAHLPNGHLIPALLAGNTVILKPSEKTPAVGEWMMRALIQAGLPNGVVQLLQGGIALSQSLVQSHDINIIAFTGSYQAGAAIHKACSGYPEKMLALEMGGNNPLVIWDTSKISLAAYSTILSSYITSGQRCVCARRLIVPEGPLGDALIKRLSNMMKGIQVKTWDKRPEGFIGPLIDEQAGINVLNAQDKAIDSGATSHVLSTTIYEHPAMLSPSLLEWEDHEVYKQTMEDHEIFGPLLQVFRVPSFEKAVDLANDTNYGLAAGLISDKKERWEYFHHHVRAGITNWNRQITGALSSAPFGGVGHSGNFRPSAYFASDYCSYPSASIEVEELKKPANTMTGLEIDL